MSACLKGDAVSTHSRPKAAGNSTVQGDYLILVSTHSRPKAAGRFAGFCLCAKQFQHTAARRRLGLLSGFSASVGTFQHTAARRRLGRRLLTNSPKTCFNTQPPEGGWVYWTRRAICVIVSTHSRPKAAGSFNAASSAPIKFQHTAARRRLGNIRHGAV